MRGFLLLALGHEAGGGSPSFTPTHLHVAHLDFPYNHLRFSSSSCSCRDYFDFFATLKDLKVTAYKPNVRIFDDVAINDGYYIFTFSDEAGNPKEKQARFSFVYRKNPQTGKWEIIDHHSSALPKAPSVLRRASTVVL